MPPIHFVARAAALTVVCAAAPALAQNQFIVADRTNDVLYRFRDLNNNGVIDDPREVFIWFSAANAAGTLGPQNPTSQAVSVCRTVIMGDQVNRNVYLLRDLNNDGDAQDAGESIIFADATNASGISFAFPTGAAFDNNCVAYVVNAGNAFGNDGIYRLVDLNGDGDAQDIVNGVPEITVYVGEGAFGPGNGPYAPQEIFFDHNNVGYLRNSSANLHGIYRFQDINGNGRADDPGEFTLFAGAGNKSGVTIGAGFPLEPDRFRMPQFTAMYTMQVITGGVDQVIRAIDLNHDGDAQDPGELQIVWENPAAGFTGVDIVSLPNGDVLITDNSAFTVVRLRDLNGDGDFMDEGEATLYYTNGANTLGALRQMDILCRLGDVNCDGVVNVNDLLGVINGWGAAGACTPVDITCDGTVNVNDLLAVINNWG